MCVTFVSRIWQLSRKVAGQIAGLPVLASQSSRIMRQPPVTINILKALLACKHVKAWLAPAIIACVFGGLLLILLTIRHYDLLDTTHAVIIASTSAAILTTLAIVITKSILAKNQELMMWKNKYASESDGLYDALKNIYQVVENRGTYPITKVYVNDELRHAYTPTGIHSFSITEQYGQETFGFFDKTTRACLINVIEAAKEHYQYLCKADELAIGRGFGENKLPNDMIDKMLGYYKQICHYEEFIKNNIPEIIKRLERPLPDSMWNARYIAKTHDRVGHNYVSENGNLRVETTMPD